MTKDELKNLSLNSEVYHPFHGKGKPMTINIESVKICFSNCRITFNTSGLIGDTRFIDELYLHPIQITKL